MISDAPVKCLTEKGKTPLRQLIKNQRDGRSGPALAPSPWRALALAAAAALPPAPARAPGRARPPGLARARRAPGRAPGGAPARLLRMPLSPTPYGLPGSSAGRGRARTWGALFGVGGAA
ncbi:hypothetical protein SAMN05216258_10836 [Albimonas pacifica]|uniref:Uncharacterized protein n=1 Tax=Albimonas pacifica TaxID=1114924 RepID=A0A1I3JKR3_9RHOB|nr:hypothetical protein SAMN05216258_10836 [Albimonas pacifica]